MSILAFFITFSQTPNDLEFDKKKGRNSTNKTSHDFILEIMEIKSSVPLDEFKKINYEIIGRSSHIFSKS